MDGVSDPFSPAADAPVWGDVLEGVSYAVLFEDFSEVHEFEVSGCEDDCASFDGDLEVIVFCDSFCSDAVVDAFSPQSFPLGLQLFDDFFLFRNFR